MTIASNFAAKTASVVAGLGLVAMAIAPAAQADSTSDLQAQIASLLAQIASLQSQLGTSQSSSMMFTTDLTVGSKGASVTALQNWLISKGFTIAAGATGTFGPQTKAALAAYQASVGISPAAGYFGPITRAKVNAAAGGSTTGGTTTGGSTSTGPLNGAEGSIDNFKSVGASNTSLNQADSDQVLGFEFKADGSDLSVNRVDFDAYNSNNQGTVRPWGLFQTATLMDGTKTIGTVDVSNQANWSQDGTAANGNLIYRVRFDGLNDVVRMGSTADFYLTLSTQNGISNSNVGTGSIFTISLPNQGLRAVDAKGIQQYSSSVVTATTNVGNNTNGSVVLSLGSDNPQTTTVQGDSNVSTPGITVNTFTLQAKDSDVTLYSLPVTVATSTGTGSTNASNMIRTLKLYQGSTLLDTESVTANGASLAKVTFQNLNLKISKGSTVPFKVVAEVNKIDGVNFPEGATITVNVPGTQIDVENGSNTVSVTGTATGNPISFRSIGLSADASPSVASAVATNNGGQVTQQTGTFTFTFNVTSFGQDIFIGTTSAATTGNPAFDATMVASTGGASTTPTATAISSTADRTTDGTNNYVIHSGQTRQVTITVSRNGGNNGFYYVKLNKLFFATTTAALSSTGTESFITLPSTYQTSQVIINQ